MNKKEVDSVTDKNIQSKSVDIIPLNYETKRILVGKGDLDRIFRKMEDYRDIRNGQVDNLLKVLLSGENFAGIFLVNKRGDNLRMVDCNHRYNALKLFFEQRPHAKVWIELHIHDNLNDEEERVEFSKSNAHVVQQTKDYVKMYRRDINLYKIIAGDSDFPVKISYTSDANRIAFHTLLHPYLTRDNLPYIGGYGGSAMDFINTVRGWNYRANLLNNEGEKAYAEMKSFLKDYVTAFGVYSKKNPFWSALSLFVIYKIWHDNRTVVNPAEMVKRLRSGFLQRHGNVPCERITYWAGMGAPRGNCSKAVVEFLDEINRVGKYKFFIIDKEQDIKNKDGSVATKGRVYKLYGRNLPNEYITSSEEN